jgi:hypothetical protein
MGRSSHGDTGDVIDLNKDEYSILSTKVVKAPETKGDK